MSVVRYYVDEHVSGAVVFGLRSRGVDVVTVGDAGLTGAADDAHLDRARAEGRVIFTQDADFLRLHASGRRHAGIAFAPQDTQPRRITAGLMLIWQVLDAEEMLDHVEFL